MLHSATDRAFLAAILEAPEDDAPRLIYADWLDEQGESDRAEFIRLQVREAGMAPVDPERPGVHARAEYLGRVHHVEWANRLPQFEGVHWEVFHRGFFIAARFDHPDPFFEYVDEVFAANPVQELRLHQFNNTHGPRLADTSQLKGVRVLDLNDGNKLANLGTEALMASRHLGRLTELLLGRNGLGSSGVRAIAMSSYARSIRRLRLDNNDLYDGLRYLADSRALTSLQRLDVDRTISGADAVEALAGSSRLRGLQLLHLSNNPVTDRGVIALAKSDVAAELRGLFLNGAQMTDAGVAAIAELPGLANLEFLFLRQNSIRDDGALALVRSPYLGRLRELQLGDNRISDWAGDQLRSRFGRRVYLS